MSKEKFLDYWEKMYNKENIFGTGPTKLAKFALELTHPSNGSLHLIASIE